MNPASSEPDTKLRFTVMRNCRPSAKQTFWKVLSRPFKDEQSAKDWMDYQAGLKINKGYRLFILTTQGIPG